MRRLVWPAAPGGRFALPAGDHLWVGYRLVEGPWHLSVTGELRPLRVAPGAPAPVLEVPDRIALALRGTPGAAGVHAEVGLAGADGAGLSLYRDGRRVALACALLDATGAAAGGAPLRYG